ncbi:PQQ-binding-like beta-propeller repeat protein [Actinomadura meridiana]|uniref:outer membrane protein assembly factor BamB family protein n=1 Tax=Actinomadura meridiana TaxID=559626 RepID=UPI0031E808E1
MFEVPRPPRPGKRQRWRYLFLLFPIAVGVVAVVNGLSGGDESSGPTAKLAWWLDNTKAPLAPHDPVAWTSGDVLALAAGRQVTGYGVTDGTKRWAVPLTGDVCAASKLMSGGRIAVLHSDPGAKCGRVQVIDVQRGTAVWQRPLPPWDSSGDKETQVVIADGVVAAQREDEGINAFRLRDGKPIWQRIGLVQGCLYAGVGGGEALVAEQTCRGGLTTAVQSLHAANGKPRWTRVLGEDTGVAGIFSTNPVVIGTGDGYSGEVNEVMLLNKSGAPAGRVKLGKDTKVQCATGEATWCDGIVLNGTTAYVRVQVGEFSGANVVAYDLTIGRRLWKSDITDRAELVPVGMDGARLIAAHPPVSSRKHGYSGEPSTVVALDPRTGKSSELMSISESQTGVDEMIRSKGRLSWVNGLFVLVRQDSEPGSEPVLAVYEPPKNKAAPNQ